MPTLKYYDGAAYQQLPGMPGVPGPVGPTGPQGPPGVAISTIVSVRAAKKIAYTMPASNSPIVFDNDGDFDTWDNQNAYDNVAGVFTCPVAGYYRVVCSVSFLPSTANMGVNAIINLNGAMRYWGYSGAVPTGQYATALVIGTAILAVGDTISFNTSSSASQAVLADGRASYMTIDLISGQKGDTGAIGPTGPAGLSGTVVSVRAYRSAAFTYSTTSVVLIYDTEQWDTQNAYDPVAGAFTAPIAGKYRVSAQSFGQANAAGQSVGIVVRKNAASVLQHYSGVSNANGNYINAEITDTIDCAVGDKIDVTTWASSGVNFFAGAANSAFAIDLLSGSGPQGVPGPTGPTGPAYAAGQLYSLVYYQTIPAPTVASSPYTVRHNLGTTFPMVQLYDATTLQQIMAQITVVDANNVAIRVSQNMLNSVNVVIMGVAGSPVPINPGDLATKAYVDAKTATLPAPVTSGSGIQSFTDALGDVWVAANGVNSGRWRRATDVVKSRIYRNAAWTAQTSSTIMVFDATTKDDYTFYNTASGLYTCPVAGWYRVSSQMGVQYSTAAQSVGAAIVLMRATPPGAAAGYSQTNDTRTTTVNGILSYYTNDIIYCAAGDQLSLWFNTGQTPNTTRVGANLTWADFEYAGAG